MLNLKKCTYSDKIALGPEGNYDDTQDGKYGYTVYYDVSKEDIEKGNYFKELPEDLCGGQIEFDVDENGIQHGQVLLWTTINDEDNEMFTNDDYVELLEDISCLVDDFNSRKE